MRFAVVILTHDEELNLPACLESLTGLDSEVFVVDSGSTDRTLAIAQQHGARVLSHPFESHAKQWHWALQSLPTVPPWVLGLDADQRLTPELKEELVHLFGDGDDSLSGINGFYIKRRQVFRGRWIRHGGYYPKYLLKLFRSDAAYLDDKDLMDHHFYVKGRVAKLRGDLIEANLKEDEIGFWVDKHNRYAVLHAREELIKRTRGGPRPIQPSLLGDPDQRTLFLKLVWYRLPLYVRPFFYFAYRYVFRLGFLDGKQGLIFHVLQGFWYRLLVDINIDQLRDERMSGAGDVRS